MKLNYPRDIFAESHQEKQVVEAPTIVDKAISPSEVKSAFRHHLEVMQGPMESVRYLLDSVPEC